MLDVVNEINQDLYEEFGDPETHARISQYEMAFRMQTSVPELTDLSDEPDYIFDLYGPDAKVPGTFTYNCLMARRLAEKGVRFSQILLPRQPGYHRTCLAVSSRLSRHNKLGQRLCIG